MSQDKLDKVIKTVLGYSIRVGDACSQLVNVAILLGENPNESISGRAHRMAGHSRGWDYTEAVIDFVLNDGHCKQAYLNDVARAAKTLSESKKK